MRSLKPSGVLSYFFAASLLATLAFSLAVAHAEESLEEDGLVYAPQRPVLKGTKTLTCIGIEYKDRVNYVSGSKCKSIGRQVADFYRRNSRGLLQIKYKGYGMKVPFLGKPTNYMPSVALAKAKYPGSDLYAVTGNFGVSHAGNGTAYLNGALYRNAQHEVGHLLGLAHAGAYKDGGNLEAYADGGSVMGKFPSNFLTAPQYYSRGWLTRTEAAYYRPNQNYTLRKITNFDDGGLALVVVLPSFYRGGAGVGTKFNGRGAYVSFPALSQG